MNSLNRRMPAEWEPQEAVLMALPHSSTDWNYILPDALAQYNLLIGEMTRRGVHVVLLCHDADESRQALSGCDVSFLTLLEADYNDTWTRDYGPISVESNGRNRCLDFGFNAWGLKFAADKDNLVNLQLLKKGVILKDIYANERDFIIEGGSIESDGQGTLLTTSECLLSPNRNGGRSKSEINEILSHRLGVDHVLWLDYGALEGDDTDSHIDTLARMAPGNTIIFTGCRDVDDPHFESLLRMRAQLSMFRTSEGNPYNLIELPLPAPVLDPDDGSRLPATYANYLVTNRYIFMPSYSQPDNDILAARTLGIAFPDHEVVGIDCRTLLRQHGSLHCATMQIPKGFFNPVIFEL